MSIVVQGVVRGGKIELVGGPDLADGEVVQVVIASKPSGGPADSSVFDEGRIHTPLVDPGLSQLISGIRRSRQPLTPGPTRSGRSSAAGLLADDGAWEQDLEEVLAARRSDGYREDVE